MSRSLRFFSDADILSRTRTLAERERAVTLQLLLHLNEIEKRKLHLKQGYSSMFDYCRLGYSEPAAFRRIRTARCVARFPEVYGLLERNEVSLNAMTRVSRVLTVANKDALLARVRGKSQREVEVIVAEYQPREVCRDVVRPVFVRVPGAAAVSIPSNVTGLANAHAPAPNSASSTVSTSDACERSTYFPREGAFDPVVTEKRVQFQFTASKAFQQKLEKIKSLAWHRLPANPSLEQVFEIALDCFIEKHDPSARKARREGRRAIAVKRARTVQGTRHVAAVVKDEVFTRDDSRCTFVSSDGRRCSSQGALQIDHIKPVARGGASTLDNLRLLCAYHNRFEATRLMGPYQCT